MVIPAMPVRRRGRLGSSRSSLVWRSLEPRAGWPLLRVGLLRLRLLPATILAAGVSRSCRPFPPLSPARPPFRNWPRHRYTAVPSTSCRRQSCLTGSCPRIAASTTSSSCSVVQCDCPTSFEASSALVLAQETRLTRVSSHWAQYSADVRACGPAGTNGLRPERQRHYGRLTSHRRPRSPVEDRVSACLRRAQSSRRGWARSRGGA